jgi:UDP-2,4-diacetamido-2,4,6-trideoxy-beta-L-altropyranose hydrolase
MKPMIVFKADSNKRTGIGCITRSLNLASCLKKKAPITFVTEKNKEAVKLIKNEGYPLITTPCWSSVEKEIEGISRVLKRLSKENEIVFVLEYKILNKEFIKEISKIVAKTIVIANYPKHQLLPSADVVINANVFPKEGGEILKSGKTKYYLGPKYMILAEQFARAKPITVSEKVRNIFVTMGGSDPENATMDIVRALNKVEEEFTATVVIGPFYSSENKLRKLIANSPKSIRLKKNLNSTEMFKLMRKSDLAISAAGISLYELCHLGVPTMALPWSVVYNHQRCIARAFEKKGAVLNLGLHKEVSTENISKTISLLINGFELRKKLGEEGRKFVDGRGLYYAKKIIEKSISRDRL